jgi:hypothetical protein
MLIYYIMNNLKSLNIDLNQILIIISAILLAIFIYNQLINKSTMLVIQTNKNKLNNCKFI